MHKKKHEIDYSNWIVRSAEKHLKMNYTIEWRAVTAALATGKPKLSANCTFDAVFFDLRRWLIPFYLFVNGITGVCNFQKRKKGVDALTSVMMKQSGNKLADICLSAFRTPVNWISNELTIQTCIKKWNVSPIISIINMESSGAQMHRRDVWLRARRMLVWNSDVKPNPINFALQLHKKGHQHTHEEKQKGERRGKKMAKKKQTAFQRFMALE